MHVWAERLDVLGSSAWPDPFLASFADLAKPKGLFRAARFRPRHGGDPAHFVEWSSGRAPKAHVIRAIKAALMAAPHPLPESVADTFSRLHGARRVVSVLARRGYLRGGDTKCPDT